MSSADTQFTKCLVNRTARNKIVDKIGKIPLVLIIDLMQYSINVDL